MRTAFVLGKEIRLFSLFLLGEIQILDLFVFFWIFFVGDLDLTVILCEL